MSTTKTPTSWTYEAPGTPPDEEGNDVGHVKLTYTTRDPHGLVELGWTETPKYDCPVAAEVAELEAEVEKAFAAQQEEEKRQHERAVRLEARMAAEQAEAESGPPLEPKRPAASTKKRRNV